MADLNISPYQPSDRAACLALFDSNTPEYFSAHERAEYEAFLDRLPGPYFVGCDGIEIVAAGGYAERSTELAEWVLCWGMVRRDRHRFGLGQAMLKHRLDALLAMRASSVSISTSQKSTGFFERFGFVTVAVIADGYGPGLDMHTLRICGVDR